MSLDSVLQIVISVMVSLSFFVLRGQQKQIDERKTELRDLRDAMNKKDDEHQKAIMTIHELLPRQYVMKDDYVRIMASLEGKLDKLCQQVGKVAEEMTRHIGKEGA